MDNTELIKEILIELKNLQSEISVIKTQIKNIATSTDNMDNHISFVESVWSVVKNPFSHALQIYYGNDTTQNIKNLPTTKTQKNITI